MKKLIKPLLISLSTVWLLACDNNPQQAQPAALVTNSATVLAVNNAQHVDLLNGRLIFSLPEGLKDRQGQLTNLANNMRVFANDSGNRSLVTLVTPADGANPEVMIEAMVNQYQTRDSNAKVMSKHAMTLGEYSGWRLDITSYTKGQETYNSILIIVIDNELITLKMAFPKTAQDGIEQSVQRVINSIVIK